jgi:5-methylcytosine-specific restriction endonuclease McrA
MHTGFDMAGIYIRTEEWKKKQRERQRSIWDNKESREKRERILRTEEYRNKQRLKSIGRKHSESSKKKISDSLKNKPKSQEHKNKLSEYYGEKASWFGRKHTKQELEKMRNAQLGSKCYNWKGGITPINHMARRTFYYRTWRESVFKRDKYTCQKCSSVGGILNAHHILKFSSHPELDNGITLCKKCHIDVHKKTLLEA